MLQSLVYEFHMTPEFARAAALSLENALWMQNERLYHRVQARMKFRPLLRKAGLALCVFGMALALVAWWAAPRKYLFFTGAFAVFGLLLLIFLNLEEIGQALRRLTRRMVSSRAQRTMAAVVRRAPYVIRYEIRDGALATQIETMKFSRVLDLKRVRMAIDCSDLICIFTRPAAQNPDRVLYFPGPREHHALCAALAANGAEVVSLPQPAGTS